MEGLTLNPMGNVVDNEWETRIHRFHVGVGFSFLSFEFRLWGHEVFWVVYRHRV